MSRTNLPRKYTEKCRTPKANGNTCNHGKGAHAMPSYVVTGKTGPCRMRNCGCKAFTGGAS